jgi:aspartate 1-decarboxylase
MRCFLRAKIHKARVTEADRNYVGSITIDEDLLEHAGIAEWERVLVVDNTNGARLETYAIRGPRGSGTIGINGAAAHLVQRGDEVIIMAFHYGERPSKPKCVLVDAGNRFVRYLEEMAGQSAAC